MRDFFAAALRRYLHTQVAKTHVVVVNLADFEVDDDVQNIFVTHASCDEVRRSSNFEFFDIGFIYLGSADDIELMLRLHTRTKALLVGVEVCNIDRVLRYCDDNSLCITKIRHNNIVKIFSCYSLVYILPKKPIVRAGLSRVSVMQFLRQKSPVFSPVGNLRKIKNNGSCRL